MVVAEKSQGRRDDMNEIQEPGFTDRDLEDLRKAKARLQHPGLAARMADALGGPIEAGFKLLPKNWNERVNMVTEAALMRGLEFSIRTMGGREPKRPRNLLHKFVVVSSGTASGAMGLASLAIELPFSTCVILRSIADIARGEGHDLAEIEVKLECLEVLALGGKSTKDDAVESGYWMVRGALAKSISDALVRLVAVVGSRFSALITEEAAAKAIPVVGALSGGTINYLFMNHFQQMAKGHFAIRRLEKKYGAALVEKTYEDLPS
jgi:hypothetical protein